MSGDFEYLLSKYAIRTESSDLEPRKRPFILHRSLWRYCHKVLSQMVSCSRQGARVCVAHRHSLGSCVRETTVEYIKTINSFVNSSAITVAAAGWFEPFLFVRF